MIPIGIWKTIPGWEGLYLVSSQGEVFSIRCNRVLKPSGSDGRPLAHLWVGGKRHAERVCRLVLRSFVGPPPDGCESCHGDGDPQNNCLDNLRWGTKKENQADSALHGTKVRGQRHRLAKLTDGKVRLARAMYTSGVYSYRELARVFSVSSMAIWKAVVGRNWGHV